MYMCTVDNKKTRSHTYSCTDWTGNEYYRVKEKGNIKEGNILVDLNVFGGFICRTKSFKSIGQSSSGAYQLGAFLGELTYSQVSLLPVRHLCPQQVAESPKT